MKTALFIWNRSRPGMYAGSLLRWAQGRPDVTVFSDQPDEGSGEIHHLRFAAVHAAETFGQILHEVDNTSAHATGLYYLLTYPGLLFLGDVFLETYADAVSHNPNDEWGYRWLLREAGITIDRELAELRNIGAGHGTVFRNQPLAAALLKYSHGAVVPENHSAILLEAAIPGAQVSVLPPVVREDTGEIHKDEDPGLVAVFVNGDLTALEDGFYESGYDFVCFADANKLLSENPRPALAVFPQTTDTLHMLEQIRYLMARQVPVIALKKELMADLPQSCVTLLKPLTDSTGEFVTTVRELMENSALRHEKALAAQQWILEDDQPNFDESLSRILALMSKKDIQCATIPEHPYSRPYEVESARIEERVGGDRTCLDPVLEELKNLMACMDKHPNTNETD